MSGIFFFTSKRYYIRQKAKWSFLYAALLFILATTESNLLCLYMYQVKYCPGVYLQKLPGSLLQHVSYQNFLNVHS